MFAFWFLVFLTIVAFVFLASSIYKPLGAFFLCIFKEVTDAVSEEDNKGED